MLDDYGALIARGVFHVAVVLGEVTGSIVMWEEPGHLTANVLGLLERP